MKIFLVSVVIVVLLAIYLVAIYNRLVTLKNRFENAFAQINVQLKRRHDLIPNLIETVKGYLKHERETLEAVVNARNTAIPLLEAAAANPGSAGAISGLASAENMLTAALGKLNIAIEDYPELKASENMQQLFEELRSTENKVAFARQSFNDAVMEYNTYKQTFPPVLVAPTFGHAQDAALLDFSDTPEIQTAPKVSFDS